MDEPSVTLRFVGPGLQHHVTAIDKTRLASDVTGQVTRTWTFRTIRKEKLTTSSAQQVYGYRVKFLPIKLPLLLPNYLG